MNRKSDFNNPVVFVEYNGESLVNRFGGPKPNGWLSSCKVTSRLGGYAELEVEMTMPYDKALDLLDDFIKGNKQIALGSDVISVQVGYNPDYFSPKFYGRIADFPKVGLGMSSTITFNGVGADKYLFANNEAGEYKGNLYDIIKEVCTKKDSGVNFIDDKTMTWKQIKEDVLPYSDKVDEPTVLMTEGAVRRLDEVGPIESIAKNENTWSFLKRIADGVGITALLSGTFMVLADMIEMSGGKPEKTFVLFGNFDAEKGIYPFEEINLEPLPTTWMGAGTQYKFSAFKASDAGPGEVPRDSQLNPSSGAQPGATVPTNADANDIGKDKTDKIIATGDQSADMALVKSKGETVKNQAISITCTISTVGIPDILPGDVVRTELGRSSLAWDWGVMSATHEWDGGYKSSFELMVGGNPLTKSNEQEADKTDKKEIPATKGGGNVRSK